MSNIEDQLELEERMISFGIDRFNSQTRIAEEQGRGADTTYARTLTKSLIVPLAEAIHLYQTDSVPQRGGKYRGLVQNLDPYKAAYFTLRSVFSHFMKEETVQTLAVQVGWYIEDELKFSQFQKEHKEYYNTVLEDFKNKRTQNYRHKHRVLTYKANERNVSWADWTSEERMRVGTAMLDLLTKSTDLVIRKTVTISRNRKKIVLVPTAEATEWINTHSEAMGLLSPDRMPCIVEPDPWTTFDQGGYYSPRLRIRSPMVKTRSSEHIKMLRSSDLTRVMSAVNALQAVPWAVNGKVLDVLTDVWEKSLGIGLPPSNPLIIPDSPVARDIAKADMTDEQLESFTCWKKEAAMVHTMEKERVSKCFQVSRVLRMANEYKQHDSFWYVYQCDFRGRMYAATSVFSPQGPDFAKGLLKFSEGKRLGDRGVYWLKVHGANTYGVDKCSYDDRVSWIDGNQEDILRAAEDPARHLDFWGSADYPWQFLAFCFEYAGMHAEGEDFISHLPVGLDGSCNGLQNFSAMLNDPIGGKATNLTSSDVPADIYSDVSGLLTERISKLDDPHALDWAKFAQDISGGVFQRDLSKRPVMTLPYGSTRQSCTQYVYKYLMETAPDYFPATNKYLRCAWLTEHLWDSINDVVVAARSAMDWLQEATGVLAAKNKPMLWYTPAGFPVYQGSRKFNTKQIDTQLAGRVQFMFGKAGSEIDVRKQKQGISPNFVHSMDACHLMMTLNAAIAKGISSFACIHDDFGTHAADTDTMHAVLREAFVELYSNPILADFKEGHESFYEVTLPELPEKGTLDINEVINSPYFFG